MAGNPNPNETTRFENLPKETLKKIGEMGGKASGKKRREKKEEERKRKTIVETLKDVLYSKVTNKTLLRMLENNGIEGEQNYLLALTTSAILKGVQRGALIDVLKLIEVLEGTATEKIEITNMDKTVKDLEDYLALKREKKKKGNKKNE